MVESKQLEWRSKYEKVEHGKQKIPTSCVSNTIKALYVWGKLTVLFWVFLHYLKKKFKEKKLIHDIPCQHKSADY